MRNSNYPTRSPLHLRRDTKAAVASFVIRQGGRNKRHARGPHLSFLSASEESPVLTVLSIRMHFGHIYPCSTPTGAHIKAVDRALLHAAIVGCCIAGPPADATALTCANIPTAYPLLGSPSGLGPPISSAALPTPIPQPSNHVLVRRTPDWSIIVWFLFALSLARISPSTAVFCSTPTQRNAPHRGCLVPPRCLSVCLSAEKLYAILTADERKKKRKSNFYCNDCPRLLAAR